MDKENRGSKSRGGWWRRRRYLLLNVELDESLLALHGIFNRFEFI